MLDSQNQNAGRAMKRRDCHVIDLTKAPYMVFGTGIEKGNPKRCIHCRKPIRKGEAWTKQVSAKDPKYGRYSVIAHSTCDGLPRSKSEQESKH